MKHCFDEVIERHGTDCLKWDSLNEVFGRDDLLSMWIADMDFRTPPFVTEAIQKRLDSGVLGYTRPCAEWSQSIINWQKSEHQWEVGCDEIIYQPGIVRGLAFGLQCFTDPGDKVMMLPPVYHPFFLTTEKNHRQVVFSPLKLENEEMHIDFERFERDIEGCKVFILCNPHNPGGRVWTLEEHLKIAEICERHGVLVFSDEIHCDLTLPPYKHHPFASVSKWASDNSITYMAPSKTFNMPGLCSSFCIIKNKALREKYLTFLEASELNGGNIFAYTATAAAFSRGKEWLDDLKAYINENIEFTRQYLKEHIPMLNIIRPQASYLIFLDCRKLGLPQEELVRLFVEDARLGLNDGTMFGKEGKGFMRLNVGCPRSVLGTALQRLKEAVDKKVSR